MKDLKVSDPISIVSHQLKNPISVLKAYIEVLLSGDIGEINPKQHEYLEDALTNIHRMATTVSELLEVSRIEENRVALHPERVNLSEITRAIVNEFVPLTKASNAEVVFVSEKDFYVVADPARMRDVVENLISNAIRYKSPSKYGNIEVGMKEEKGWIVFSCKDNGIGIQKEDKEKVFKKFYRSAEASSLDSTGTGLGLYINKAIIELSGGEIWLESRQNEGTTVYFKLPKA